MAQITILVGGVSFKKKKEAFLRGGPAEGLWVTPAAQVHTLGSLEVVPSPRARRLWHMEALLFDVGISPRLRANPFLSPPRHHLRDLE